MRTQSSTPKIIINHSYALYMCIDCIPSGPIHLRAYFFKQKAFAYEREGEREREREKEREGEEREGCICAIPVPFPCPSHVVLRFHLLRPSGDLGPTRLGPVGGGLGLLRATLGSQLRRDPIPARWTKERRSRRYRWRMVCFFVGRWGQVLWEGDSGECSR